MYFDLRTYFRFLYLAFFRAKDCHFRLPAWRVVRLLLFFSLFPVFELFTAICLLLDHVFFPGFRRLELPKPLFIVGPHRSGTTYLQRLLARDDAQFFSLRFLEIVFPSILQTKAIAALGRLLGRRKERLKAAIRRHEARRLGSFSAVMHEMSLFEPDEDELLLIHTFSTLSLLFLVHASELEWLMYFDEKASHKDRKRIMRFYRACLQRQAYCHGGTRILLSKAPYNCFRIDSLYRYFPGCRQIYTIRNPLEAVPSMLDMARAVWQSAAAMEGFPLQAGAYDVIKAMYRYPLARFAEADAASYEYVVYDTLLQHPSAVVRAMYEKFGYELREPFQKILEAEDEKQRAYRSPHEYSLDQFGISREQILRDFRAIFARFDFGVAVAPEPETDRVEGPAPGPRSGPRMPSEKE
ncbi:MAG: sulfotransferase [Candidatus Rokubacteria bacterium]|nr:sulfotransferase [Candidatus Rokubacteria bacterium]